MSYYNHLQCYEPNSKIILLTSLVHFYEMNEYMILKNNLICKTAKV